MNRKLEICRVPEGIRIDLVDSHGFGKFFIISDDEAEAIITQLQTTLYKT